MSGYRVAVPIEGPRIDVSGAISIIDRSANRLSFLLDSLLYEPTAERTSWWSYARDANLLEKHKQRGRTEKTRTISAIYGVIYAALDDLVLVHGLYCPEEMIDWAWLVEAVEKAPLMEWKGPDISCELLGPIDCLDLLLNHPLGRLGAGSLQNFSPEGFLGFKVIIEDVRKNLHKILAELNSTGH